MALYQRAHYSTPPKQSTERLWGVQHRSSGLPHSFPLLKSRSRLYQPLGKLFGPVQQVHKQFSDCLQTVPLRNQLT